MSLVTPYVGVWIETLYIASNVTACTVTPYVGVWIETTLRHRHGQMLEVTPYVGVWIETQKKIPMNVLRVSLLMWECGLKLSDRS